MTDDSQRDDELFDRAQDIAASDPDAVNKAVSRVLNATTQVELNGMEISVTPMQSLPPARAFASYVAFGRMTRGMDLDPEADISEMAASLEEAEDAALELLELCINDGVTHATLKDMDASDLVPLFEAALGETA